MQGCIKPLCDLLDAKDVRIVTVALEGLENILRMGKQHSTDGTAGEYANYVDAEGGLDKIEELQNHQANEVYEKVRSNEYSPQIPQMCGLVSVVIRNSIRYLHLVSLCQAMKIMRNYFSFEEEADTGMAPGTDDGGQFVFGAPQAPQGDLFFGCDIQCRSSKSRSAEASWLQRLFTWFASTCSRQSITCLSVSSYSMQNRNFIRSGY